MDLSAQQPIKTPQSFPLNQQIIYNKSNYDTQPAQAVNIMENQNQGINNVNMNYPNIPTNQMIQYPPNIQNPQILDSNALLAQICKGQEEQKNREKDKEIQDLKDRLNEERIKQLQSDNNQILANQRMVALMINRGNGDNNININNNNNNVNTNIVGVGYGLTKLNIPGGMWCIIFLINLFLPGLGTIIAGIMYGKTVNPDRTGVVICHGITQIITFLTIIGWIWALIDTVHYFG